MYTGSADFQTANGKPIQKHRITGYVDTVPFTAAHILAGSLTITNQCSDSSDVKIGAVFVGKLTVTFLDNLLIPVSTWKGRKITVQFGLCIDEVNNTWESFSLGEFYVSEANITLNGIAVTAYDVMSRFDKQLPSSYILTGQASDILHALCDACSVTLGMTDLQIAQLPNGTRPLGMYQPNDCVTYRDALYWLSATMGGFATINRQGKLVIVAYENISSPTVSISDTKRVTGARFSDFATDFGSIVFDNDDGTQQRIGSQGVGATYMAGFNPFVQYGTTEAKNLLRTNIFLSVQTIKYTPFSVSLMSAPIWELGDPIEFTGGIVYNNNKTGVVQSITFKAGQGVTIQGFGKDPALQNVENANQAANSAAARAQQNSEVVYKDYTNLVQLDVEDGEDPVKVVEINFTTSKKTDVEVWHEFLLETDTSSSMTLTAVYYLDNVEVARKPVETFSDSAEHVLDLHYFRTIDTTGSHKWEVFLESDGGDATIDINGAIACLKGQGLSKVDAWTGVIVLDDTIEAPDMVIPFGSITDSVTVSVRALDHRIQLADTIVGFEMGMSFGVLVDTVNLIFYQPTFALVTEDAEYNIVTEDENYNIVTG